MAREATPTLLAAPPPSPLSPLTAINRVLGDRVSAASLAKHSKNVLEHRAELSPAILAAVVSDVDFAMSPMQDALIRAWCTHDVEAAGEELRRRKSARIAAKCAEEAKHAHALTGRASDGAWREKEENARADPG